MDYSIGSWNVRTVYASGALRILLDQLDKYKIGIAAIQETKWLGKEIMEYGFHVILKSGKETGNREFGVAFVVSKELKHKITHFEPINERICSQSESEQDFSVCG